MPLKPYIKKLTQRNKLLEAEAREAFTLIFSGGVSSAQIAAFVTALRVSGEEPAEIVGAVHALRAHTETIQAPAGTIDTCGTGGSGHNTLNVSTAAAIVVAACGVPVAKHGNRGISSSSGSADVLAALGVNLNASKAQLEHALRDANICFMFAPHHNKAMQHVAEVRRELGVRTIFNILGPLLNPARAKRQLLGVYSKDLLHPMAEVLQMLGSEHAWVVHGHDGLDEITITAPTDVIELKDGKLHEFKLYPLDYGIDLTLIDDIHGQDAPYNAAAMRSLFTGQKGAYRDIVLLNSAAALVVAGKTDDIPKGLTLAAHALDGGGAQRTLERLVAITQAQAA
jgi:anthranilate phosphoribosyltransferase